MSGKGREDDRLDAASRELLAACGVGDAERVRSSLRGGASVNARDAEGWTPLMRASAGGHRGPVNVLLTHRPAADVRLCNRTGRTALHLACANGHSSIALALLFYGSDATQRDIEQRTALDVAAHSGHAELMEQVARSSGVRVPNRLEPPMLENARPQSLTISWSPSAEDCAVADGAKSKAIGPLQFRVELATVRRRAWRVVGDGLTRKKLTVRGLRKDTAYLARVRAKGKFGWGAWSEQSEILHTPALPQPSPQEPPPHSTSPPPTTASSSSSAGFRPSRGERGESRDDGSGRSGGGSSGGGEDTSHTSPPTYPSSSSSSSSSSPPRKGPSAAAVAAAQRRLRARKEEQSRLMGRGEEKAEVAGGGGGGESGSGGDGIRVTGSQVESGGVKGSGGMFWGGIGGGASRSGESSSGDVVRDEAGIGFVVGGSGKSSREERDSRSGEGGDLFPSAEALKAMGMTASEFEAAALEQALRESSKEASSQYPHPHGRHAQRPPSPLSPTDPLRRGRPASARAASFLAEARAEVREAEKKGTDGRRGGRGGARRRERGDGGGGGGGGRDSRGGGGGGSGGGEAKVDSAEQGRQRLMRENEAAMRKLKVAVREEKLLRSEWERRATVAERRLLLAERKMDQQEKLIKKHQQEAELLRGETAALAMLGSVRLAELEEELEKATRAVRRRKEECLREEAAAERSAGEDSSTNCVICLERQRSVLLLPCKHLCLCAECAAAVSKVSAPKCPVCRTSIAETLAVFS